MEPSPRQDLLDLEERLQNDTRDFGALLAQIPRDIFILHNGNAVINPHYHTTQDVAHYPVFAVLDKNSQVHMKTDWRKPEDFPEDFRPFAKHPRQQNSGLSVNQQHAVYQAPPISWLTDAPPVAYGPWSRMLQAMIKYLLLNWASTDGYDGKLPQPDYDDLSQLFQLLKKTHHYAQSSMAREGSEFEFVEQSLYHAAVFQPPASKTEKKVGNSRLPAPTRNEDTKMSDAGAVDEIGYDSGLSPTQPEAIVDGSVSPRDLENVEVGAQQHQIATVNAGFGMGDMDLTPAATDSLKRDHSAEIKKARQQPYPTPDPSGSEEVTSNTDPVLARLHGEAKLGHELLSLLPELRTMVFQKITHDQPGYLPVRMLIGVYKKLPRKDLSHHKVWISYKVHDKDGRAAPRMLIQAFHPDTGDLVCENLKFADIFPLLDVKPVFSYIRNNVKGEMQFKAIAKYYFILAANDRLLGFKNHRMPVNETFIGDLRTVCTQIQKFGGLGADSDDQRQPPPKRRKGKAVSRRPSISEGEASTTADLSQVADQLAANGARRTCRRIQEVVSAPVSDHSGFSTRVPTPVPESLNASRQSVQPRRFALGKAVIKDSEKLEKNPKESARVIYNEYLDDNAEVTSSDGESGDEIPDTVPHDIKQLLDERYLTTQMIASQRIAAKESTTKAKSIKHSMRYNKGRLKRGKTQEEVDAHQQAQEQDLRLVENRFKVHDEAARGFKERKKALDAEVDKVDKMYVDVWDAMNKKERAISRKGNNGV
ncbi:hypothetical protein CC80DRAFT_488099 [Byssothecium circinans]|uniref:Uncharacterized protein n=1 Tax=Byssothecium circinans TaxID=147558 RepID=A0A6A5U9U6_9PLEO|nr:hypothetical protein CC80DRAFT_488099 [Byssothecium circinans]